MLIEIILLVAEGIAIGSIFFCEINFIIVLWKISECWLSAKKTPDTETPIPVDLQKNNDI